MATPTYEEMSAAYQRACDGNNILDESPGRGGDESSLIAASKGGA
jgi:hypothetical protein